MHITGLSPCEKIRRPQVLLQGILQVPKGLLESLFIVLQEVRPQSIAIEMQVDTGGSMGTASRTAAERRSKNDVQQESFSALTRNNIAQEPV